MAEADGEEVELPRMHALRHPQRNRPIGHFDLSDRRQRVAHQHGRAACAHGVLVAVEPQQQRVSAELEEAATVRVRNREHRFEHVADRIGDLLGSDPASFGERFGQLREAGNIDESRRAFAGPRPLVRVGRQMLDEQSRHIRGGVHDVVC